MSRPEAAVCRCLQIDIVIAGAAERNVLAVQISELFQNICIECVIDEYADAVAVAGEVSGILRQFCLVEFELDAVLGTVPFKGRLVVRLCIKKSESHNHSPSAS